MKEKRRPWQRWALLAGAALELWVLWHDVQEYRFLAAAGIFSPEVLEELAVKKVFSWMCYGLVSVIFLFYFAAWRLPRPGKTAFLADGILFSCLTLAWGAGALYTPYRHIQALAVCFYAMLLLLAGMAVYSFWNYQNICKT